MLHGDKKPNASLLGRFMAFVICPRYDTDIIGSRITDKIRDIFKLWSLGIVLSVLVGWLAAFLITSTGVDLGEHSLIDSLFSAPWYIVVFLVLIWAPVTEELTFRLGLRYSPYRLGFSLAFICVTLLGYIFTSSGGELTGFVWRIIKPYPVATLVAYGAGVIIVGSVLGRLFVTRLDPIRMRQIYTGHFTLLFYLSVCLFAFLHIFNYYDLGKTFPLFLLLLVPQFVMGLLLGFIRMRYGIVWSMIAHLMHNGALTVPVLIYAAVPDDMAEILENNNPEQLQDMGGWNELIFFLISLSVIIIFLIVFVLFFGLCREFLANRKIK